MSLPLQIGLGVGLAVAAGLRPFLPALLAGLFASEAIRHVQFSHGDTAFLQRSWWLIAVAVAFAVVWVLQMRIGGERLEHGPLGYALIAISIGTGALLFGGILCDHDHPLWAGLVAGAACAAIGLAATRPLLSGARRRLPDRAAREALTLYADGAALVLAALSLLWGPLGFAVLVLALWLLISTWRRADDKYAGLRILR
jgi:hypothetical protein